ncbi:MAG: hypothetical protein C0404_00855 [Verrucomicrobia bacterium]|nr:hypothetical protein [Verrucomicrobiota bacterium]
MQEKKDAWRDATLIWVWNDAPGDVDMDRQLLAMKSQGFGQAVIKIAPGLDLSLRSDLLTERLSVACRLASKHGFGIWVYDDVATASRGDLSGMLSKHPEYRMRSVRCYMKSVPADEETRSLNLAVEKGDVLLAALTVDVDCWNLQKVVSRWVIENIAGNGAGNWSCLGGPVALPPGNCEILICVLTEAHGYSHSDGGRCLDVLNPGAVDAWIKFSYDSVAESIGEFLGTTFRGLLTIAPPMAGHHHAVTGWDREVVLPWTHKLPDAFHRANGFNLVNSLTALVSDGNHADAARIRRAYRSEVARMYRESYPGRLRAWCEGRGILLAGGISAPEDVASWVGNHGDYLKCAEMFHVPVVVSGNPGRASAMLAPAVLAARVAAGIGGAERGDVLALGCGRPAGFETRLADVKTVAGLNASLGISSTAVDGFATSGSGNRRKVAVEIHAGLEPAAGLMSFCTAYSRRVSSVLRASIHDAPCAVIYPASDWLASSSSKERAEDLLAVVRQLIERQLDFDVVHEERLASGEVRNKRLLIDGREYRAVILPPAVFCNEARERVEAFRKAGCRVCGPGLSSLAIDLKGVPRSMIVEVDGNESTHVVVQERRADGGRIFLINYTGDQECIGLVVFAGAKAVAAFDFESGMWRPVAVEEFRGGVRARIGLIPGHLVVLSPDRKPESEVELTLDPRMDELISLDGKWRIRTDNPNILYPREWFILRNDEWLPVDGDRLLSDFDSTSGFQVRAEFAVNSVPADLDLAYEPEYVSGIKINGRDLKAVDKPAGIAGGSHLARSMAGLVVAGENLLEFTLTVPVEEREITGDLNPMLPPVVIAGRFGVRDNALVEMPAELEPGSWVRQGFPRFCGSIMYSREFKLDRRQLSKAKGRKLFLRADVHGGVMKVRLNGRPAGLRAWAPYSVEITDLLQPGDNLLEIEVTNTLSNLLSRSLPSGLESASIAVETDY